MTLLKEMVNGTEAERNYEIFGYSNNVSGDLQFKKTKSPSKAIEYWFKLQKRYNLSVSIMAMTKDDALLLLDWATKNTDKIIDLGKSFTNDYNVNLMVRRLKSGYYQRKLNKKPFQADESVEPFSNKVNYGERI